MISVTDEGKQVIVPSMGTIGEILLRHLKTIRQLEQQVGKLRLALDSLQDREEAMSCVDKILDSLKAGTSYL